MHEIKVLIVEDEMIISEDIKTQLEINGYTVCGQAETYQDAVELLTRTEPDLVLLDIQLKGQQNGIDLANYIKKSSNIPFIYLTSFSDGPTIEKVKNTQPNAFLLKPFRKENVLAAIEIAIHSAANQKPPEKPETEGYNVALRDCLFVKKDYYYVKVKVQDIQYIKAEGNYLQLTTLDKKKFIIRSTIKGIQRFLSSKHFFQTHKSFIVNLQSIVKILPNAVEILEEEIPLAKSRKDLLLERLSLFS